MSQVHEARFKWNTPHLITRTFSNTKRVLNTPICYSSTDGVLSFWKHFGDAKEDAAHDGVFDNIIHNTGVRQEITRDAVISSSDHVFRSMSWLTVATASLSTAWHGRRRSSHYITGKIPGGFSLVTWGARKVALFSRSISQASCEGGDSPTMWRRPHGSRWQMRKRTQFQHIRYEAPVTVGSGKMGPITQSCITAHHTSTLEMFSVHTGHVDFLFSTSCSCAYSHLHWHEL
jgi:hypothetical protein